MIARVCSEVLAIATVEVLYRDKTTLPGDIGQGMFTGPQQLACLLQPQVQVVSGRRTTQAALE
jgi:hypothetical protein